MSPFLGATEGHFLQEEALSLAAVGVRFARSPEGELKTQGRSGCFTHTPFRSGSQAASTT
jgi:hypothetical protein